MWKEPLHWVRRAWRRRDGMAALAASPDVAVGHGEGRTPCPRPLFFCHIPKTAGTSLRAALEQSVRPFDIVPDAMMMSRQGGFYPDVDLVRAVIRHQGASVKLFRGHYHYSCRALMPDSLTMTVLREPVARVASHIRHNIVTGLTTAPDALKALDGGNLPHIPDNLMVRYLGGTVDAEPDLTRSHVGLIAAPIEAPEARLASALENLGGVDILGLTENLDAVVRQIRAAGFQLPPLERHNATARDIITLSDRHLQTIRDVNALDVVLYEAARREVLRRAPVPDRAPT